MAGVGFELKKLFRARTAVGHVKAYAYASVVTTGPFLLMTGMVLAVQLLFSAHGVAAEDAMLFVISPCQGIHSKYLKIHSRESHAGVLVSA